MAISLGKTKESKANVVEDRLRARLADIEGRLEDSSKIKQLEQHIVYLNNKHELDVRSTQLAGHQAVESVKAKATEVMNEAKRRFSVQEARYAALVGDLARLQGTLAQLGTRHAALAERGLDFTMLPIGLDRDATKEPREFVAQLIARQREIGERLSAIEAALGDGKLDRPTSDIEILESRTKELLTNPELKSKALTVAEKARLFASDPGKSQYYRELVVPYAEAICQVLQGAARANVVHGAQEALAALEVAFRDSRTFLLRRSGDLDDHAIHATVTLERLEEGPEDALGRMQAVLDNARSLGPVDFFHNIQMEIARRVERGEPGAKAAAWILSDVTVTLLEDPKVREWLASQR